MLSRPSFSIRRLISQRKPETENKDELSIPHDTEDSTWDRKSKTWPKGSRKGPIPTIDIRRSEDLHRIVVLPPLPDTPKSWTSSVYSCDDEARFIRPRSSPTPPTDDQRSPNRTPQRSPLLAPQQLGFLQRPRSSSLVPLSPPPLLLYSPPSSPQSRPRRDTPSPVSPLDSADAPFSAHVDTGEVTPKWTSGNQVPSREGSGVMSYSGDIEQLIRETDEAFRLWQSSEIGLPSPPPSASGMCDDASRDSVSMSRASLARRTSQRSTRSSVGPIKSATKQPPKIPILATPSGQTSVSKTKKPQLKNSRQRARASVPGPASRWTLTESAKDLFTIRIFNRIEADEMLPESVLHEIRMSRATQARLAKEAATRDEFDADMNPTEPEILLFNEIPTWIGAKSPAMPEIAHQDMRHSPPTRAERGSLKGFKTPGKEHAPVQPIQQSEQVESPIDSAVIYNYDEATHPILMVVEDLRIPCKATSTLPKPPVKNRRRRSPMKQKAPLPTIPEVIAVGTETSFLSPTSRRTATGSTPRLNTDDYIFLPATSYTFNMPGFRHGRIRLAKVDLPIGKLAAAVDDTLDWTAFQMAIIGGAGDFFSESTDYSRPSDAELAERDDVANWFAEFGFDGPGSLVPAADAARTHTPPDSPVTPPIPTITHTPVAAELEVEEPPRYSNLHLMRSTNNNPPEYFLSTGIGLGQEGVTAYHSRASRLRSGYDLATGLQIDPPKKRGSAEGMASLPQSPMLDLVVSRDVDGNEYVVPMGFNLGHDLGDFLKWEADHVFGGGYYGPDPV